MLLKLSSIRRSSSASRSFSTLYRVDAIEAYSPTTGAGRLRPVSVPSIGSMLLKRHLDVPGGFRTAVFQYPLSGRCY